MALGLGEAHGENAFDEVGLDAVFVDVARQGNLVREAPQSAFAAAQDAERSFSFHLTLTETHRPAT